jgi:hypothetical protein
MADEIDIAKIKIGPRFRKDLGNIDVLAEDISTIGLLQPVVLSEKNELIDGARRIAAYKQLGRSTIPFFKINLKDIIRGEFSANQCRKSFTLDELCQIKKAIEPILKAEAEKRKGLRTDLEQPAGKFPAGSAGRVRDKIAAVGNISGKTLDKAAAVFDAAEKKPALKPVAEEMNKTGNVDKAYKRVVRPVVRIPEEKPMSMIESDFYNINCSIDDIMENFDRHTHIVPSEDTPPEPVTVSAFTNKEIDRIREQRTALDKHLSLLDFYILKASCQFDWSVKEGFDRAPVVSRSKKKSP